ncbi:ATP synthase F1 subunit gamma [Candidatus Kaiserbacteria bacterium CG10_big_fil_rev_8_21_14_0_10_51_14]|uniref:ATP synthase gamma chain n=1 Tax=Candidatus Kaiserbacteria bacterium CG10_big_fil_rev_8_21_14_0_10_51_14 TaxID=1974610 RepID=A0A2H0UCF3_9BACT|nr:MAG: ATP synthase F1 subunit gamma [Candidatus Kaiserbacteria bacterium CG10_big_fil_rev_8_21_14_0_10_51_14]
MASLKNIKLKILSYKKTGTVTHAMEAVSAVKMRKGQERALSGRAYAAAALSMLERLAGAADLARHPLMRKRAGKTALVVVTSDKGLAGALNSGVIRKAEASIRDFDKEDVIVFAFGRRGGDYFASRGFTMGLNTTNVSDGISESEVREITRSIIEREDISSAFVAYQNFISTFEQIPTVHEILPIRSETMRKIVEGIRPARGKYAPQPGSDKTQSPAAYTVEPDPDTVLSELLPKLLNIAVFHALLESKASEHSARMVAMKSATDKAKEMAGDLTRTFNKVRQAAITREVSEITSGIEAMR